MTTMSERYARHYVISGNGRHGNPEIATLQMILEARGRSRYTIHLTNRETRLERFFAADRTRGRRYAVVYRDARAHSVRVDVGSPLPT